MGHSQKIFPQNGVRKSLIPDHLAMQMVKSSKDYEFSDILMHISNYKPVEPHAPEREPDTEDEDTDIPGIDDIFHEESNDEESSGLASEDEKTSDDKP
ncbi:uncharacterized protein MONOS_3530 [Monocercomonoides exilis]|uniref:uncharacterized protein n=1 Tax=Monocercomonoides exilis TaxID=2049356 RepID=UPI003559CAD8|nr:hypothetical protein MONOS_3530 [Monocercomonoides exilis]|eukprot:MONOS_3530.1-p1 / transcript=MONOS_3530.1 / gene=MONOS_3530 / organism=Monocercomonoides_exilis_PA203 / gene_product=unspecified product / transcript_product=unspecified product / location=Mono_scaffold00083:121723-122016(-) / protein_length=98 / sequence_SO=supercontig / SO=protein_coding / is_pseudo=false